MGLWNQTGGKGLAGDEMGGERKEEGEERKEGEKERVVSSTFSALP